MKSLQRNYLLGGIAGILAGIFLIYKNSLGKYIDPWISHNSRYRGHASSWLVVIGIMAIIVGIFLAILAFTKDKPPVTPA
jgi:drug/metabolite transporter (DMT)-like permease